MTEQLIEETPRPRGRPRHTPEQRLVARMLTFILSKPAAPREPVYGEWLRDPKNAAQLSAVEQYELVLERAWEVANPREVAELDAMVGRTVRFVRDFRTYATDDHGQVVDGGSVPSLQRMPAIQRYAAGRKLVVFARCGQVVLGRMVDGVVLAIRKEWVSV